MVVCGRAFVVFDGNAGISDEFLQKGVALLFRERRSRFFL